jgi:hypothetical protein
MTLDGVIDAPTWTFGYEFLPEIATRTADDDPAAPFYNDITKYVVSSTLTTATCRNSRIIGPVDERLQLLDLPVA